VNKFDRTCFLMTWKKLLLYYLAKKNLQFLAPLLGFTLTVHSNQHRSFPPTIYSSWTHYVLLAFVLLANKHPTSYEDVSAILYQRLHNLVWMFFHQLFMLTSKPPFTTQWQQCGGAVNHLEHSCWRKIQFLGLSKHYGKKGSKGE
jgi:hypothetical protein